MSAPDSPDDAEDCPDDEPAEPEEAQALRKHAPASCRGYDSSRATGPRSPVCLGKDNGLGRRDSLRLIFRTVRVSEGQFATTRTNGGSTATFDERFQRLAVILRPQLERQEMESQSRVAWLTGGDTPWVRERIFRCRRLSVFQQVPRQGLRANQLCNRKGLEDMRELLRSLGYHPWALQAIQDARGVGSDDSEEVGGDSFLR